MEQKEFNKLMKEGLKELNIEITENQTNKFFKYMEILINWNEKFNLTAIIEPRDIIIKHFIDSATIIKHIKEYDKVIDIGTGAGFPGIPIKILKPNTNILLLDSSNKKVIFLEEVIKQLELKEIKAIHARAEDYGKDNIARENFDIVVSRAVANLRILSEYTIPFLKSKGKAILMKGLNIEIEVEEATKAISILGGEIEKIENFCLPKTDMKRNNIIINKVKATDTRYPRKAGTAKKGPII